MRKSPRPDEDRMIKEALKSIKGEITMNKQESKIEIPLSDELKKHIKECIDDVKTDYLKMEAYCKALGEVKRLAQCNLYNGDNNIQEILEVIRELESFTLIKIEFNKQVNNM